MAQDLTDFANDRARGEPVTRPMAGASDSQKGGSIQLGMWQAARHDDPGHVILFTDADLSTHLGQAGLLMHPILAEGADAEIAEADPTQVGDSASVTAADLQAILSP